MKTGRGLGGLELLEFVSGVAKLLDAPVEPDRLRLDVHGKKHDGQRAKRQQTDATLNDAYSWFAYKIVHQHTSGTAAMAADRAAWNCLCVQMNLIVPTNAATDDACAKPTIHLDLAATVSACGEKSTELRKPYASAAAEQTAQRATRPTCVSRACCAASCAITASWSSESSSTSSSESPPSVCFRGRRRVTDCVTDARVPPGGAMPAERRAAREDAVSAPSLIRPRPSLRGELSPTSRSETAS
eukprot:CAMPEP_0179883716 /NCGR_PEP_ID=MMETSP0982-20121206/28879_1 /TAXON_ID=483367 /ORGANISM="non described non described, Strain CCMP 2436" /LENGTH=242 /DNA_ID=CAMNT_0021778215 /DNA_START=303 /DNA_END=1030 /DNA_ORIENTATION=+